MNAHEKWHYGCSSSETYIKKGGATIRRNRNLAGLMRYSAKVGVSKIESRVDPLNSNRGELRVTYSDGAQGFASFASYPIMVDWIRNRRSWRNVDHFMGGPNTGYLTKPGQIAGV